MDLVADACPQCRSTTSAFHLGRAALFGGAGYVATGRGFSLRRKTFTQVGWPPMACRDPCPPARLPAHPPACLPCKPCGARSLSLLTASFPAVYLPHASWPTEAPNPAPAPPQVYINYGRSHLYLGADLLIMIILILVVGNNGGNSMPIPAAAMWSPLLVSAALLAGPFWFTPYFFRLHQVRLRAIWAPLFVLACLAIARYCTLQWQQQVSMQRAIGTASCCGTTL